MLGEGFDHPRLSVSAIFRPFRSLAPYVQFVGRVMRVIQENEPDHPDNQGHIVSHIGLNNDARWSEFRDLDLEDQELVHAWVTGGRDGDGDGNGEPRPRRFDEDMLVDNEILSSFVDQAYLDPTDDRVLDEMLDREVAPGVKLGDLVNRDQLRKTLLDKQTSASPDAPTPIPVSPQRRRKAARTRLNQRVGAVVNRVLDDLDLPRNGREVAKVVPGPMQANVQVLTRLLNKAVTGAVGDTRGDASADQLESAFHRLDELGDRVREELARKL
jgi:hypothetical protein